MLKYPLNGNSIFFIVQKFNFIVLGTNLFLKLLTMGSPYQKNRTFGHNLDTKYPIPCTIRDRIFILLFYIVYNWISMLRSIVTVLLTLLLSLFLILTLIVGYALS
ncbi:hypothetical protein P9Z39_28790 [Bacillus thuringiensis]|nr:hypothetical protein [Bacillus thuringiensis]MEC2709611.1 hypothetical protein [Bacillus thuringiensis]